MTPIILQPVGELFSAMRPRKVRTMRDFAEQEIILPPGGPYAGEPFSYDLMPWTGLLLDEFTAGRYNQFAISGPAQDGKTTLVLILPVMYYLFELRKNIILAAPKMEIAWGKFEEDIKPMIEQSRFAHFIPITGRGSRGGKAERVLFGNGAAIRFMAAGGGDEQRSSFPAEAVFITEADKMDEPGKVSREADPVTQIIARTFAFDKLGTAKIFIECTMSNIQGRINQEITVKGTDTKIHVPCPHCHEYVVCERENFRGWQEAKDIIEARENAAYACPECKQAWTEADRMKALRKPVFAARGQTVNKRGKVQGAPPRVLTFGFSWNAMSSALKDMAFISEREFIAAHSEGEDAMKALMQFIWALPWEDAVEDLSGVNIDTILAKIGRHPRGVIPPDCTYLTAFVDTGIRWLHWMVWAWRLDAQGYCLDYGEVQVPQPDRRNPDTRMVLEALRTLRDEIFLPGWTAPNGARVQIHLVLVDAGWKSKITYAFIRESNELSRLSHSMTRYFPSMGLGTKTDQKRWHSPKPSKDVRAGPGWFIRRMPGRINLMHLDSDGWKAAVHNGFRVMIGNPGSLSLYDADRMEHFALAKHMTSERCLEEMTPRGAIKRWIQKGANHWFDCAYGAMAGAYYLGVNTISRTKRKPKAAKKGPRAQARRTIRYRY